MIIQNPVFLIFILTGVIFVLAGLLLLKFPPKEINMIYGYRTRSSMKSKERWDFAQKCSSKEFIKSGVWLIILSALGSIIEVENTSGAVFGLAIMILCIIIPIIRTEKALKLNFNDSI